LTKWREAGRKYVLAPLERFYYSFTARRLVWGVIFFLLTALLVGVDTFPRRQVLEVGQPSPQDFLARQTITYESEVLTAQAREQAARQVEPLYRLDNQALALMES